MANKAKAIGREAENGVADYLAAHGWPHAERRVQKGANDEGDITGTPALVFEVKSGQAAYGASDKQILDWAIEAQIERNNARADVGILVLKRYRVSREDAGRWWAYLTLSDLLTLHGGAYRMPDPVLGSRLVRIQLAHVCEILIGAGYGQAT